MIFICGVTGRVGRAAATKLLAAGLPVRGLVRNRALPAESLPAGLEIAYGDFNDPASLREALGGISRALLVSSNSEEQETHESNFVEAAAEAGVRALVKISSMEAGPSARAPIPKLHYAIECQIKEQMAEWTLLQPNFFMQNLLMFAQAIKKADMFALPFGDTVAAPVDSQDVGEAAAVVLQTNAHNGATYTLCGERLMSFAEIAETLSEVCGRTIRYVDQPAEEFRAFLANVLHNEWHLNAICELFAEIKAGALARSSDDLCQLLGRPPTSLGEFASRYRPAFATE